jgi:hypothetical protein
MAVSGANRGGWDKRVPPRSDGSWHLEDVRRRREQRQAAETTFAVPTPGEPEEDFSSLALSLADNAMTTDGTPLSQLETRSELDGSNALGPLNGNAPTAEEIMRALETGEHAAASKRNNRAGDRHPVHSPPQPRASQGPPPRRLHARRRWVIACTLAAAVAALLAVEVTLGGGTTVREQRGRSADSRTAAPTAGLIAAATDKFLAMEHAAYRSLATGRPPSTRAPRPPRHRNTPARAPSGSTSSTTATSSTSGASEAVDASQQAGPPSPSPSSSSTSTGSSQPPPQTQPHTSPNSNSSPSTPSKAALKSLVTGAGTCSCQ